MKYKLPYFPEIDTTIVEEYYVIDIKKNEQAIKIDLNFKNEQIDVKLFDKLQEFIEDIKAQDIKNRTFIKADFRDANGETKKYLEEHIETIPERLKGIINFEDNTISPEEQLLQKLKLLRIGFYPDKKYDTEVFAIYDYTIDDTITDELLVINLDKEGKLMHISWES